MNLDPTRDSIEDIAAAGTKAVMFPLWRGFETTCRAFVDASAEREIAVILCLDRRSFTEAQWRWHRYLPGLRYWAKRFPDVSCWLVGNEPDQEGDSSSPMTRRNFQRLCRDARSVWPEAYLIAGALARVAVSYVDGLEGIVNACAVNIYCQRPADGFPAPNWGFANLCDLLAMFPEGMPIFVNQGRAVISSLSSRTSTRERIRHAADGAPVGRTRRVAVGLFWLPEPAEILRRKPADLRVRILSTNSRLFQ